MPMPIPVPSQMSGEYQMPAEEYRSVDALNFSTAKHALKSPLAYKAALCDKQTKATSAMELGTLAHTALLEPSEFKHRTMCAPQGARRGSKAWTDAATVASSKGKMFVKQSDYDRASMIADSVRSSADAMRVLESDGTPPWLSDTDRQDVNLGLVSASDVAESKFEASYFWFDKRTGLRLKARVDCVSYVDDMVYVVDFKTTEDASPRVMSHRLVAEPYHYLIQLAWYCRALKAEYGEDVTACIIAAEKSNGFTTGTYMIEPDVLEVADKQIDDLLDTVVKIEAGDTEQMHYTEGHIHPPEWWYKQKGLVQ